MVLAAHPIGAAPLLRMPEICVVVVVSTPPLYELTLYCRHHFLFSEYPLSATPFGPKHNRPKREPSAATNAVAAAAAAAAANQSTHPPIALSREPTLAAQSTHAPHAARSGDLVRPAEL